MGSEVLMTKREQKERAAGCAARKEVEMRRLLFNRG